MVSIRLPDDLVARVGAVAKQLQAETPLLEVNRTDALRYLLQVGLDVREKLDEGEGAVAMTRLAQAYHQRDIRQE